MWPFSRRKGASGFSSSSTAEKVTQGIDGSGLTAIVTGYMSIWQDWRQSNTSSSVAWCSGVQVTMAVRNTSAGRDVKEAILEEIPTAKLDVMELDLSSFSSVRKFASDFSSSALPLNILINNAGVGSGSFKLSKDNIELQFATNHLGHFLLTNLLLETMKKTSCESGKEGRIVNVSSDAHHFSYREGIRFEKINDLCGYGKIGTASYGQSKLANILHANELRLKEEEVNITANSVQSGIITTNYFRQNAIVQGIVNTIGRFFMKNVQQGAATTCYVALHPLVQGVSDEYFVDSNLSKASSQARDMDLAKKLWDFSLNLTG